MPLCKQSSFLQSHFRSWASEAAGVFWEDTAAATTKARWCSLLLARVFLLLVPAPPWIISASFRKCCGWGYDIAQGCLFGRYCDPENHSGWAPGNLFAEAMHTMSAQLGLPQRFIDMLKKHTLKNRCHLLQAAKPPSKLA